MTRSWLAAPCLASFVLAACLPGEMEGPAADDLTHATSDLGDAFVNADGGTSDAAIGDAAMLPTVPVLSPSPAYVGRGRSITLTSDQPVVWTSLATAGTLTTVDATSATFRAPSAFTTVRIRATHALDPSLVAEVDVHVGYTSVDLLAGRGSGAGLLDGPVASARSTRSEYITVDAVGQKLYVTEPQCTIRRIDLVTGIVTTLMGGTYGCGFVDGGPGVGKVKLLRGLAVDGPAGILYIGDGNTIRKLDLTTRVLTTVAGAATGTPPWSDGIGTAAILSSPRAFCLDGGVLWFFDGRNVIRKLTLATSEVTTVYGTAGMSGWSDSSPVTFGAIAGLAADATYLYAVDAANHIVRRIKRSDGSVITLAGTGGAGSGLVDSSIAADVRFATPMGVASSGNNLIVGEPGSGKVRAVSITSGATTTFPTPLPSPFGVAVLGTTAYVAMSADGTVWKLDTGTGNMQLYAFTGIATSSVDGDGPTVARLGNIDAIVEGMGDTVYVLDGGKLRKLTVTRSAGDALGATLSTLPVAILSNVQDLAFGAGSLFAAGSDLKRVDLATNSVTTIMTGVLASDIELRDAAHAYLSSGGGVYLVDLVAGTSELKWGDPVATGAVDGNGLVARFGSIAGLLYDDAAQRLYVSDGNYTLRSIDLASGEVTTVAGAPGVSGDTDGAGTSARLGITGRLVADGAGGILFGETRNRLRRYDTTSGAVTLVVYNPAKAALDPGPIATAGIHSATRFARLPQGEIVLADDHLLAALR